MNTAKAVGALILLAAVFAFGWYSGSLSGRLTAANRSADLALDQLGKVVAEQKVDREDRKKLQKALDGLPRSQGKVRDALNQNPSGCVLPPDVVSSLQSAIRKANASREMPSNP